MSWLILIISGLLETVWAAALHSATERFRIHVAALFLVAASASLVGLAVAMRSIPIGTAYAAWVGIGAVGTVAYGAFALGEPLSALRLLCVGLVVAGVVGLKFA